VVTGIGDRVLPFAGIHNFRDYGGYAVPDGRLVRGRLYRSAQHRDASPEDLEMVAALGLAAVIDLRSNSERRVAPCPRPRNFSARVLFVDDETVGLAPHVEAARNVTNPDEARASICRGYTEMPFRPQLKLALRYYFEALAAEDGATLIYCMAGKDRTGIAVALFQSLMGVHRDDIISDYLLTNQAGRIDERIVAGGRHVRAVFGAHLSDDAVRVLMSVEAQYLQAAFDAITTHNGSVVAYLGEHIAMTPAWREQILRRVITARS